MMDCTDARTLAVAWEKGQNIGTADLAALNAHLAECPTCAHRFMPLFPLLARDGEALKDGGAKPAFMPPRVADKEFTDRVMARIAGCEPESGKMRSLPYAPGAFKLARIGIAAAALLLVTLGLGIGLGLRTNDTVNVRFVLDAPDARTVELAANFTNWETVGYALRRVSADGPWELKVSLKKGALYSYNFVIDGEVWIPDPSIPEKVDDGFGGASSLLRL